MYVAKVLVPKAGLARRLRNDDDEEEDDDDEKRTAGMQMRPFTFFRFVIAGLTRATGA
jgi:hypothetical protein